MSPRPEPSRYDAFDMLATMVAVVRPDGGLLFVNAMFENVATPACGAGFGHRGCQAWRAWRGGRPAGRPEGGSGRPAPA